MLRAFFIVALLVLQGCAKTPIDDPNLVKPLSENAYASLIKRNTAHTDQYSGFYQTFQADVTILNSEVQAAGLRQRAHFLQWDQRQHQAERDRMLQEAAAYSKFYLRFFSPEHEYDDFHKGKTIWKVYLEYGGSRFEGKVKKLTEKFVEIQNIYPQADRFSTNYEITFNVPMATLENGPVKVILTSSLGSAEFKFPPSK